MSNFSPCFIIPCYNHGQTVAAVIDSLVSYHFPIIIIDDGSDHATQQYLQAVTAHQLVTLIRLPENQGKGGAVSEGLRYAFKLGMSHGIQIDADGQHDLYALPNLIKTAQKSPEKLISGQPVYDASVPKSRLYARYITHAWVWIETLSFSLKDSMCGFRAYPLQATVAILESNSVGLRMDFDTEIMVRLYWSGTESEFVNTHVIYPEDGISHFDALWDNVRISWMHTRLCCGMFYRAPALLKRKFVKYTNNTKASNTHQNTTNSQKTNSKNKSHWSKQKEQGTILGIKLLLAVYRMLGRPIFRAILMIVMSYYYLTNNKARCASQHYLQRFRAFSRYQTRPEPKGLTSYRHMLSFGETMLDKLAAWQGDIALKDADIYWPEELRQRLEQNQGGIILGSHLGNLELCRALSQNYPNLKINALVFTAHAQQFNTVLQAVNADSALNLIQVDNLGPETAILLQQKIEQGEWVVIVGDRTSVQKESRVTWARFLGTPAPFPQGPFILASILKAPVFFLFALRDEQASKPHFNIHFEFFTDQLALPRKTRQASLDTAVQQYAERLQHYTLQAPLQWYNFFEFWNLTSQQDDENK